MKPELYLDCPETFEFEGRQFRVTLERDDCMDAPWLENDGHGEVSEWTTRDKRPGEMVINEYRGSKRYYDFAGAVAIAKRDGWNAKPYFQPGEETRGQRAHKAAMADFRRLKAWCDDEWCWCVIAVELLDDACEGTGEFEYLGGVESDAGEYLWEVAEELAAELLA